MREDRIKHRAEDDDADDDTDGETHVMQRLDAPAHVGHAFAQVPRDRGETLAGPGAADDCGAETADLRDCHSRLSCAHGSQLRMTSPIAIANSARALDAPLPVAAMGQQELLAVDFCLPRLALPVGERQADIGMAPPRALFARQQFESVITNPGGPPFIVPGDELHCMLRPGLWRRLGVGFGSGVVQKSGREDSDQNGSQQTQSNFGHWQPRSLSNQGHWSAPSGCVNNCSSIRTFTASDFNVARQLPSGRDTHAG